jgi:hypothetical protein
MADSLTHIHMFNTIHYETDPRLGKILLAVFLVAFVLPFALIQAVILVNPSDNISWEMPLRIKGALNMRSMEKPPQVRVELTPLPESRTPRIKGIWRGREIQTIPQYSADMKPLPEDRPPRIKGVWNMRTGGKH